MSGKDDQKKNVGSRWSSTLKDLNSDSIKIKSPVDSCLSGLKDCPRLP